LDRVKGRHSNGFALVTRDRPEQIAWLTARLRRLLDEAEFWHLARRIDAIAPPTRAVVLKRLLLVELSARPRWMRALEWVVWCGGSAAHLPIRWLPKTRGPFQLFNAPLSFDAAVLAASEMCLQLSDYWVLSIAWSGAASRQPASLVSYETALRVADCLIRETERRSTWPPRHSNATQR
jgi:hypothetical protein